MDITIGSVGISSKSTSLTDKQPFQHQQQKQQQQQLLSLPSSQPPPSTPKWKPMDDILLKESIQTLFDCEKIATNVKFSARFTASEIEDRWKALLYDEETAKYVKCCSCLVCCSCHPNNCFPSSG